MGAIKWTGEALKFVGEIMTAEGVEEFLKDQARLATARVVSWTVKDHEKAVKAHQQLLDVTGPFRVALENALSKLPSYLLAASRGAFKDKLKAFYQETGLLGHNSYLCAVPRALIIERFGTDIEFKFGRSAQLPAFPNLIKGALSSVSVDAERAFFEAQSAEDPTWFNENEAIVDVDMTTIWKSEQVRGHYYIGYFAFRDFKAQRITKELKFALDNSIGCLTVQAQKLALAQLSLALIPQRL